jgi:hypothetical protein
MMFGLTADRWAMTQRFAQTARALQASALDAASLLEQQAGLVRPPGRLDHRAEIKRWRAFADQAEQMAKRWEQPPDPSSIEDSQDRLSMPRPWRGSGPGMAR